LRESLSGKGSLKDLLARQGEAVSDDAQLMQWVRDVIAENPDKVEAYRSGRTNLIQFFVGQVMRLSKGRAQAQKVKELMEEELGG
jgi:Asp-tRNA(Asn)/Glu-tRNA(Gln) amidotransferase B subunit